MTSLLLNCFGWAERDKVHEMELGTKRSDFQCQKHLNGIRTLTNELCNIHSSHFTLEYVESNQLQSFRSNM